MIKTAKFETGTIEEFFERSKVRAKKLDRGETLATEIRVIFEDPADLSKALSTERLRVLTTIRNKTNSTISGLAISLERDRKAVSRDVKLLEKFGLLRTRPEANPGHGVMTIVEPLAKTYHLSATIGPRTATVGPGLRRGKRPIQKFVQKQEH